MNYTEKQKVALYDEVKGLMMKQSKEDLGFFTYYLLGYFNKNEKVLNIMKQELETMKNKRTIRG